MSTQDNLRPGTTFTHSGEHLTVTRVIRETVIVRDRAGHTRRMWLDVVHADLAAAHQPRHTSPSDHTDATLTACAALGITPASGRTRPAADPRHTDKQAVNEMFHDAEEFLRRKLGQHTPRSASAREPNPIIHLFTQPDFQTPDAA